MHLPIQKLQAISVAQLAVFSRDQLNAVNISYLPLTVLKGLSGATLQVGPLRVKQLAEIPAM